MTFELDFSAPKDGAGRPTQRSLELGARLRGTIDDFHSVHAELDVQDIADAVRLAVSPAQEPAPGTHGALLPDESPSQRSQFMSVILGVLVVGAMLAALFLIRRP